MMTLMLAMTLLGTSLWASRPLPSQPPAVELYPHLAQAPQGITLEQQLQQIGSQLRKLTFEYKQLDEKTATLEKELSRLEQQVITLQSGASALGQTYPSPLPTRNPQEVKSHSRVLSEPSECRIKSASGAPSSTPRGQKPRRIITYVVRKGDSLKKIAKRYGTSIEALCTLNRFRSDKHLQPGQVLKVSVHG